MTVIYSDEAAVPKSTARPAAVLPLLVTLFIFSYGILTMLVFEQGQTIESQRSLIREMMKDSTQLATLKGKLARDDGKRGHDKAVVPADPKKAESGNPETGAKKDKEAAKRSHKSSHPMKEVPEKPAADLEDVRRATRVI